LEPLEYFAPSLSEGRASTYATTIIGMDISRQTAPTKQSAVYTLIRIIPGIAVKGLLQSAQHIEDLILSLIGSASSIQGILQQTNSRKVRETKQGAEMRELVKTRELVSRDPPLVPPSH
jgi:hypothetical protein